MHPKSAHIINCFDFPLKFMAGAVYQNSGIVVWTDARFRRFSFLQISFVCCCFVV